jgi:hypothetical protein
MLILKQTTDLGVIKEEEYGLGQKVQFTMLDSCIGVCAKTMYNGREQVIGIHLVHFHTDDTRFTVKDMEAVQRTLTHYGCVDHTVMVVGDIGCWEDSNPEALKTLRDRYQTQMYGREHQKRAAGLGAELKGGQLVPIL